MACKPQYKGKRYNSLEELYKANGVNPQQKQQAIQLYSQYIDTIFPDSKVKDIVYHGSKNKEEVLKNGFSKEKVRKDEESGKSLFEFTTSKIYAQQQGNIIAVLLNVTSDNIQEQAILSNGSKAIVYNDHFTVDNTISSGDMQFGISKKEMIERGIYYTVFDPEQIHILGTDQDIKQFKEFLDNNEKGKSEARESLLMPIATITSKNRLETFLSHVQHVFPNIDINYVYDDSIAEIGYIQDGKVYINMNKAGADVMAHELAHVFSLIIKASNPTLWNKLSNEAQELINTNSPLVQDIRARYGELSNEDMIMEVIANAVQNNTADRIEAMLLRHDSNDEEKSLVRKFFDNIKLFWDAVVKGLNTLLGRTTILAENMPSMTLEQLGNHIVDAIDNNKVMSYMSSDELAKLKYDKYNAIPNRSINNGNDLANSLTEYTTIYAGKTDNDIVDILMKDTALNNNILVTGDQIYDYKEAGMTEDEIRKHIIEYVLPYYNNSMTEVKNKIVSAITNKLNHDAMLSEKELQNALGKNQHNQPRYSIITCKNLIDILKLDKTKKVYLLKDIMDNKDGILDKELKDFKDTFLKLNTIDNYNPIIVIENITTDNKPKLIMSIHDITNKSFKYVERNVGRQNILYKYGVTNKQALKSGIQLKNEEFAIRSVLLTAMAKVLMQDNIEINDLDVIKFNEGTGDQRVLKKCVDMTMTLGQLYIFSQNKEFMDSINNDILKEVFTSDNEEYKINNINYWELLGNLYEAYYYTGETEHEFDPDSDDWNIVNYMNEFKNDTLTIQKKLNLIKWRLAQLNKIEKSNLTEYQINEMRLLLDAYSQMRDGEKLIYDYDHKQVIDALGKYWSTFDINSHEVQVVRKIVIEGSNKIVDTVRKRKEETRGVWEHFKKAYGGIKKYITNPYFMYENMFATIKTKEGEDAHIGRIYWTTDTTKDEFAGQAQQKISAGKVSQKDLEMANIICDKIEDIYIEYLKHQQWKINGGEKAVAVGTSNYDTLTKEQWLEKLYARGYKRGMIPIMPKTYIDGMKSAWKRFGLEVHQASNEFTEATSDILEENTDGNVIDDLNNIFLAQLSNIEVPENTITKENKKPIVDSRYGYIHRNNALGLIREDNGEYIFSPNKGREINANMNVSLEYLLNFFDLAMTRKRVYEREVLPVVNATVKMIQLGKMFSIDKSNEAVVDIIRNYCEMAILGSSSKIRNFGRIEKANTSIGEILATFGKGFVGSQMFLNINIGINSAIINLLKSTTEAISGDPFLNGGRTFMKANMFTFKNVNKVFKLATNLHIIRGTEYDTYTPGYGGSVSNRSWFTQFTSSILNWATDSHSRSSVMIAKMMADGVLEAYQNTDKGFVYIPTKDKRYFNSQGNFISENHERAYNQLLEQHEIAGIETIEENGKRYISQPYTWEETNAIKEYADKRIIGTYDNLGKSILGNGVLGRLALMYFNWFPAAIRGIIGKGMFHETIFDYKMDNDGNLVKNMYFSEGMLTTLLVAVTKGIKPKDMSLMSQTQYEHRKRNIKRLITTISMGVLLKLLFDILVLEDDEDDDLIKGSVKGNRLLKNFDYASEGLFMFAYKDGLKRLNKPFPMVDAFAQVFDNGYGNTNLGAIRSRLPLYNSVNTVYEAIAGEKIGEEEE